MVPYDPSLDEMGSSLSDLISTVVMGFTIENHAPYIAERIGHLLFGLLTFSAVHLLRPTIVWSAINFTCIWSMIQKGGL